jgi:hypothetical protein
MVASAALPAMAAQPYAGVNGFVTTNGTPNEGATVSVYRLPVKKGNYLPLHIVHAKADGSFSVVGLERGYYLVAASSKDGHAGCTVANLNHVVVSRVRISLGQLQQTCDEVNVRSNLVASDQGGNLTTVTIP